ncbi:hypothetical protein TNCV_69001 [Trichonephila clavipes]|nr:hypothetical protein TNCV_69001 [Trichonephila clavipes]
MAYAILDLLSNKIMSGCDISMLCVFDIDVLSVLSRSPEASVAVNTTYTVQRVVVPTKRRNMSHSSCQNQNLKDTFGDRLISRFGPVNWPPRSCDLTPLDYFLWGYVKSLVYADKPQTLDHLEDNIRRVIADIRPQTLEKVI